MQNVVTLTNVFKESMQSIRKIHEMLLNSIKSIFKNKEITATLRLE